MPELIEEDGPEKIPSPLDAIRVFVATNEAVLEGVELIHSAPSIGGLEEVEEIISQSVRAVMPLFEHDFFKKDENDMMVVGALTAVMKATEQLSELAKKINIGWVSVVDYGENSIKVALESIMGGDEAESRAQVSTICNNYKFVADNLNEALVESRAVEDFMEKQKKRERRKEILAEFGLKAAATYVGVALALKLHGRK